MNYEGARVREQGVEFGVLMVKPSVLHDRTRSDEMRRFGVQAWGPMPIVLMAQDNQGVPTYSGRRDIVDFLANLHPAQIPWKRWLIN